MVRYEIEKQLIDGTLEARDVPQVWNRLYKEYLGLDVPNDTLGCLQDSHWSGGSIGYFPSYSLGSAYGAQLLAVMSREMDFYGEVARGNLAVITAWLKAHIHRFGCLYDPGVLLEMACGEPFDPKYYTDYLTKKYSEIYDL
jgi:carboxypeptidase Taq